MPENKTVIPPAMMALRQEEAGGRLNLEEVGVPRPRRGEVLVKMDSSPINPSDLAMLRGGYLQRNYPYTPGLEGSGTVVRAGAGILPRLRMGARVACSPPEGGDGTWAEYMCTTAMNVVPLPRSISLEQGSMMLVNPMTAMAFILLARKEKHKAVVNNAAASSLGKMLIRLCDFYGVPLINIVRKEKHLQELTRAGAEHVLNSQSPDFASELKQMARHLGATLFLDAVTGKQTAVLLKAAPAGSKLVAYARLSGENISMDPQDLILENKTMEGFQLGKWLHEQSLFSKLLFLRQVKKHLRQELTSTIRYRTPLREVEAALEDYRRNMSEGKIILTP